MKFILEKDRLEFLINIFILRANSYVFIRCLDEYGEVAEWFKAHAWKAC